MNPMMVRIFDINAGRVVNRFLNMCTTSGATAEIIYNAMDAKLSKLLDSDEPWMHCSSISVDNTSTNIGIQNSLKTRIIVRNEAIYFSGCQCHIIHNSEKKGGEAFEKTCGFDVEDLVIDLFYWFEKSTKRKNTLKSFCSFCDQDYRSVIKHVNTRWLTLELAVERCLLQFVSLKSYFLSEHCSQDRFKRLHRYFENPMKEVYLLFYQAVSPTLPSSNKF